MATRHRPLGGRPVMITGAASGIGQSLARQEKRLRAGTR
jgi:NAD(P)-dependent dehydrogenase (short-subunit alcohol dehydrogenase family)